MREAVLYNIFLDLQKVYYVIDRDRCLKIIAEYGVGPRALRILRTYWGRLTMVSRDGVYYASPFKGYCGVTQGYPLHPKIFNVVVDAITRHWVTVVADTEGLRMLIQDLAA